MHTLAPDVLFRVPAECDCTYVVATLPEKKKLAGDQEPRFYVGVMVATACRCGKVEGKTYYFPSEVWAKIELCQPQRNDYVLPPGSDTDHDWEGRN